MDSYGLSRALATSSTLYLELLSTLPRTLTSMNSYGLLWSFLYTLMDSAELLQHLPPSDLSFCLHFLELWLQWTPMDSFGLFSQAGSVTHSQTLNHMVLTELLHFQLQWTPIDSFGLFSQAGSVSLSRTLTPFGLLWTQLNSCSIFQLLTWACVYSS
jgi:hypothetical protein